jgi:hypothetical protein
MTATTKEWHRHHCPAPPTAHSATVLTDAQYPFAVLQRDDGGRSHHQSRHCGKQRQAG